MATLAISIVVAIVIVAAIVNIANTFFILLQFSGHLPSIPHLGLEQQFLDLQFKFLVQFTQVYINHFLHFRCLVLLLQFVVQPGYHVLVLGFVLEEGVILFGEHF